VNEQQTEPACIELSLPLNATYVQTARLTASSVANRNGFDTDEIEDIKAAVSEACTYIIRTMPPGKSSTFVIKIHMSGTQMWINIHTDGTLTYKQDEMSLVMVKALMDKVTINEDETGTSVEMIKNHTHTLFRDERE
jgi:serine/threonine-protein kinase RsbW